MLSEGCELLLEEYFQRYPDYVVERRAKLCLRKLRVDGQRFENPRGWMGALVYLILRYSPDKHQVVLNSELTEAFGVSMSTIRKRAGMLEDRAFVPRA